MYWTPAKMLLLADVDEYSFANAVLVYKFMHIQMHCYKHDYWWILLYKDVNSSSAKLNQGW